MARVPVLPDAARPLIFAHRGYSTLAPENTMAAFRIARDHGVPGVELDVHRCKSGELVVSHDGNLLRVSGKNVEIASTDYETLRSIDIGSWFSADFASERVPLLSELFRSFARELYFDVEIKHHSHADETLERELGKMIKDFGLKKRTLVSSFDPVAIGRFKRFHPDIPTAIIYSRHKEVPPLLRGGQGRFFSFCDALKPHRKNVSRFSMFFDRTIGRYPVIPWTVDETEEAERLLSVGVDGIISNDPGTIRAEVHGTNRSA